MKRIAAIFAVGISLYAGAAAAQTTTTAQPMTIAVGPRVGFVTDGSDLSIGAEARLGVFHFTPTIRLDIRPSFDWVFVASDFTFWYLSGDGVVAFDIGQPTIEPYGIVGIGIFHASADLGGFGDYSRTKVGLNLGGGARFLIGGRIQPFAEIRASIESGSFVQIAGGVLFAI